MEESTKYTKAMAEDQEKKLGRRELLKALIAGGSAVAVSAFLPGKWIRPVVEMGVLPAHAQLSGAPLAISPLTSNIDGCTGTEITFTASGGVPPYSWSVTGVGNNSALNDPVVLNATQATWDEDDDFCDGGTASITVEDNTGATATAQVFIAE